MDIPGYKIISTLGEGGMATVYLAIQESFEREVALKVLDPRISRDSTFSERFLTEARIVSRLMHPNIVTVYDVGSHNGLHFLSMEYVPGRDLKHRRFELSLSESLQVVKDVARALDYAARKGCVHRDVKPDNIMLHAEDGRAVLMDFGIARIADFVSSMTQTGTAVGTPHYMSPEQARGIAVDGRSDLYSLGVVTFLLLTGYLPYDSGSAVSVGVMHISDSIPRLPPHLSDFQGLIDRAMAKKPEDRFQSGAEFISAVNAFSESQLAEIERVGELVLIDEISGDTPTHYHPPEAWSAFSNTLGEHTDEALNAGSGENPPRERIESEALFAERDNDSLDTLETPPRRRSWAWILLLLIAVGGGAFVYQAPLLDVWGTLSETSKRFVESTLDATAPAQSEAPTPTGSDEEEPTLALTGADPDPFLAEAEPSPPAVVFDPAMAVPLPMNEPSTGDEAPTKSKSEEPSVDEVAPSTQEQAAALGRQAENAAKAGELEQALTLVERGLALAPNNDALRLQRDGLQQRRQSERRAQRQATEQATELRELNQLAARIESHLQQGELDAANELLRPARERYPGSPELLALAVQLSELEELAQKPVIESLRVSPEPPVSLGGGQEQILAGGRVLYAGFRFRNFEQSSTVIQAILYDGSRQAQIAQVPVIVQEEAGENFFQIERAVSGFAEGAYVLDLMVAGERLGSTSFQIKK